MLIVDILAMVASLGVKLVGFPAQLRAGRAARTAPPCPRCGGGGQGMVWQLSAGMCLSYLIWVVQGAMAGDWTLAISQAIGVALTAALLVQARPTQL